MGRSSSDPEAGASLSRLAIELARDFVFLRPWIRRGGADLGALFHLRGIRELRPDLDVCVVLTTDRPSEWADRVPEGVRILRVPDARQLTRALLDWRPQAIHVL